MKWKKTYLKTGTKIEEDNSDIDDADTNNPFRFFSFKKQLFESEHWHIQLTPIKNN